MFLFCLVVISEYNTSAYPVLDENVTEIFSTFIHGFTVALDDVNACSSLMRCSKGLRSNLKQLFFISESCRV